MSQAETAVYSYDEVPYASWPYAQSHPDRLGTIAALFGMRPRPVDRAQVLELGCAGGGNLIPMAVSFPNSRFVGVELSPRQLAEGQAMVDRLGLTNIELLNKNILDAGPELGKFHYIVVHGVYSWVPEKVQEKILAICAENLEPDGVAYVSYNTYPGWRMRQMLRDMLCYHTRAFRNPADRAGHARALLGFLSENVPTENNPYGLFLKQEVEEFAHYDDHYLLHDHLEEVNDPVYFHEFIERARRHNLQYLAEADLGVMATRNFPPKVEGVLRQLAKDVVQMEQYMDFLRNRQFRQTLLCHAEQTVERGLDPEQLTELFVASPLQPQPADEGPSDVYEFRGPRFSLRTGNQLFAAALKCLAEVWPSWLRFSEVLTKAGVDAGLVPVQDATHLAEDRRQLAGELLECCIRGGAELHSAAPPFVRTARSRPLADPLARLQAESGTTVTNRRHERVELNDLGRHVIRQLDGNRDNGAVLDAVMDLVRQGVLVVQDEGRSAADPARARTILEGAVQQTLQMFARSALLVG